MHMLLSMVYYHDYGKIYYHTNRIFFSKNEKGKKNMRHWVGLSVCSA
jgi:CRISPR/Cas system-associated endonuclease Cas1